MFGRRRQIIAARFEQGRNAYHGGHDLAQLLNTADQIDAMHDAEGVTNEQHDEIANSIPSLFAGYASGLIDDIRLIAARGRGLRA